MKEKLIRILKVILLLSLLIFFLLYLSLNKNNCDACKFEGKKIDKFLLKYSDRCFTEKEINIDLNTFEDYETHT